MRYKDHMHYKWLKHGTNLLMNYHCALKSSCDEKKLGKDWPK